MTVHDDRQELPARSDAEWTRVAERHHDPTAGTLATTLAFAVAEAPDTDPTELRSPPLYDCIDTRALERTFFGTGPAGSPPHATGAVQFHYREYLVRVRSDGHVAVYAPAVPW